MRRRRRFISNDIGHSHAISTFCLFLFLAEPITNTTNKRFVLILFLSFFFLVPFFLLAQVYQTNLIHYPNITHTHGLVTTIVGLQVVLDGSHFKNGSMRVKCLASVSPVLSMSTSTSSSASGTDGVNGGINNGRISYVQRRPLLDNREAMLLGMCSMFIACKIYWSLKMVTATSCLSLFFRSVVVVVFFVVMGHAQFT